MYLNDVPVSIYSSHFIHFAKAIFVLQFYSCTVISREFANVNPIRAFKFWVSSLFPRRLLASQLIRGYRVGVPIEKSKQPWSTCATKDKQICGGIGSQNAALGFLSEAKRK